MSGQCVHMGQFSVAIYGATGSVLSYDQQSWAKSLSTRKYRITGLTIGIRNVPRLSERYVGSNNFSTAR